MSYFTILGTNWLGIFPRQKYLLEIIRLSDWAETLYGARKIITNKKP